jgi:arylsulfatase A-like enzyme
VTFPNGSAIRPCGIRARLGVVVLLLLVACSRESPPSGVLHLVPEGVEEQSLIVGAVTRMGFSAALEDSVGIGLQVPEERSELRLACALDPAFAESGEVGAVGRAWLIDRAGRARRVWEQTLSSDRWASGLVDLTTYAGSTARLLLEAIPRGRAATGRAYWATPTVTLRVNARPNVLLICIDSLRADHLGCYGYARDTSPTIDSLASVGSVFDNAIAQSSWTLPSHASLFTSLYQKSHGVNSILQALGATARTLAEQLRTEGYVTVAVISGGPLSVDHGLNQGFDVYDTGCWEHSHTHDVTNECTHARATAWLRECGSGPFFLFAHYWDVHYDYLPPAPYDTLFDPTYRGDFDSRGVISERLRPTDLSRSDVNHLVALYDGEIAHTDRYVGMLLAELAAAHLSDNTIVALTSDHGDELFDHGTTGHGHTLYQELVRVPLIWVDPSRPTHGTRLQDMVQLVDVPPTILQRLGLHVPESMQGESMLPLMGGHHPDGRVVFSEVTTQDGLRRELVAGLLGKNKIVFSPAGHMGEVVAFDLASDPGEQRPQQPQSVSHGEELREALSSFALEGSGATVEVRIVGAGASERRDIVIRLRPGLVTETCGRDLESGDSLEVRTDPTSTVLALRCLGGDVDGVSFDLRSAHTAFVVGFSVGSTPLDTRRILLGAGESPADGAPFKARADDPRLRGCPQVSGSPGSEPKAYVWAVDRRQTSAVPVQLDETSARRLRALGYLW